MQIKCDYLYPLNREYKNSDINHYMRKAPLIIRARSKTGSYHHRSVITVDYEQQMSRLCDYIISHHLEPPSIIMFGQPVVTLTDSLEILISRLKFSCLDLTSVSSPIFSLTLRPNIFERLTRLKVRPFVQSGCLQPFEVPCVTEVIGVGTFAKGAKMRAIPCSSGCVVNASDVTYIYSEKCYQCGQDGHMTCMVKDPVTFRCKHILCYHVSADSVTTFSFRELSSSSSSSQPNKETEVDSIFDLDEGASQSLTFVHETIRSLPKLIVGSLHEPEEVIDLSFLPSILYKPEEEKEDRDNYVTPTKYIDMWTTTPVEIAQINYKHKGDSKWSTSPLITDTQLVYHTINIGKINPPYNRFYPGICCVLASFVSELPVSIKRVLVLFPTMDIRKKFVSYLIPMLLKNGHCISIVESNRLVTQHLRVLFGYEYKPYTFSRGDDVQMVMFMSSTELFIEQNLKPILVQHSGCPDLVRFVFTPYSTSRETGYDKVLIIDDTTTTTVTQQQQQQ